MVSRAFPLSGICDSKILAGSAAHYIYPPRPRAYRKVLHYYSVGDRVLVRVLTIDRGDINHISITADIRSVSSAANQSNLDKCVLQGKYAGRVTDVRHGVVFIRLNNGVNAVAHTCYDRRMPGKKDDVSFAVTRLDEERGIAVGIITRIIKQNL